ncbi:MAG: LacI family DNA-binding transcriptional regulator [Tetrasphaera sp.]
MPPGPYRIADIASQAGLSVATVDRVLHGRAHVSDRARRQVERAIAELRRQESQLRLDGLSLVLDLVMQSPERFSAAARHALEAELPRIRPANIRSRFHFREGGDLDSLASVLDGIGRRGHVSDGVILKAPDDPVIAAAVDRLRERGIPVVTLVTDVRRCRRIAYVGLDNVAAGATAAYLLSQWVSAAPGAILLAFSDSGMVGEQERLDAFTTTLARLDRKREVVVIGDAGGLDPAMGELVRQVACQRNDIIAVYSIGGGNRAIAAELRAAGMTPRVHIGHDLDADNDELLRIGVLSAVLHHELQDDMRRACEQFLRFHRILPGAPATALATPEIVTAYNLPRRLGPTAPR